MFDAPAWAKLIPDGTIREAIQWGLDEDDDLKEYASRTIKGSIKPGELLESFHKGLLLRIVRGTVVSDHIKKALKAIRGGKSAIDAIQEEVADAKKHISPVSLIKPTGIPLPVLNPNMNTGIDFEGRSLLELEEEGHRYFSERFERLLPKKESNG